MGELIYKNVISTFFVDDQLIAQRKDRIEHGFQFVLDNVPNRSLSEKLQEIIKTKVASVEVTFLKKWRESKSKTKQEFEGLFEKWIQSQLKLPPSIVALDNRMRGSTQTKKTFEDLSRRQKSRRADELSDCSVHQLLLAAAKAAKRSNLVDLEYVLKLVNRNHTKATQIRTLLNTANQKSNRKKVAKN